MIDGKYQSFEVHYSQKKGFFLKDFPDEIWQVSQYHVRPTVSEEYRLYNAVNTAIHEYHEAKNNSKKMIWIKLSLGNRYLTEKNPKDLNSVEYRKDIDPKFRQKINSSVQFGGVPSTTISLNYQVVMLVDKNGSKMHQIHKDGKVGGALNTPPERALLVEYTVERKVFLVEAMQSMDRLANLLISFFQQPDLTSAIDTRKSGLFITEGK